jgi:hypothetical protein
MTNAYRRNRVMFAYRERFNLDEDEDLESCFSWLEAVEGNTRPLSDRVLAKASLSQRERDFIADHLLAGTRRKRSNGKPPKRATHYRHFQIAQLVYYCQHVKKWGHEAAVQQAMEAFGVSRSTVTGAVQEIQEDPDQWQLIEHTTPSERSLKAPQGQAVTIISWNDEPETLMIVSRSEEPAT